MSSLLKLTNPEFEFEFAGQNYTVRKANLDKAVQYQEKVKELMGNKDAGSDLKLVAYCIYLILKDQITDLTFEQVMQGTPADIDVVECLVTLGFINPKKAEVTKKIEEAIAKNSTTENSSS